MLLGPHGNFLILPTAVPPYSLSLPTSSHTHWIRKVNLNTSVHISRMPQRKNSCWPLLWTHDPICPKRILGELQLIYTISTSYGECKTRRVYSPHLLSYIVNVCMCIHVHVYMCEFRCMHFVCLCECVQMWWASCSQGSSQGSSQGRKLSRYHSLR